MLFMRSIGLKLVIGLGLVGVLIFASVLCSKIGVNSIQSTVDDLELSMGKLPRKSDLQSDFGSLFIPLVMDFPDDSRPLEYRQELALQQHDLFLTSVKQIRVKLDEFIEIWQKRPDKLRHKFADLAPYQILLMSANRDLSHIESVIPSIADPARREASVKTIQRLLSSAIENIKNGPDPADGMAVRLREARSQLATQHLLITVISSISVIVLIGLMLFYYRIIVAPITELTAGVKHISAGDYGYRIHIRTQCEIGTLAKSFNEMSARIQADSESKEREIQQRSKQLVQSERLAGAGFLASGVAHEINNPLSVIMTAGYGLEMRLDDGVLSQLNEEDRNDVREYLGLIQSEAERCERITKKLLDFSYGKGDERNSYDITAIIDEVISMVGHLSRYQDRNLIFESSDPLHAWVNAPEIKQVILNLVANALDATPGGGTVKVEMQSTPHQVEIDVKDNGCGMTAEQMAHIFEPFFTTKDVGKGTGLGLAISHRIVRDHQGTLEVTSEGPGHGSRFTLRIPRKQPHVRAA